MATEYRIDVAEVLSLPALHPGGFLLAEGFTARPGCYVRPSCTGHHGDHAEEEKRMYKDLQRKGAGYGSRTRDLQLGKLALYRLS